MIFITIALTYKWRVSPKILISAFLRYMDNLDRSIWGLLKPFYSFEENSSFDEMLGSRHVIEFLTKTSLYDAFGKFKFSLTIKIVVV